MTTFFTRHVSRQLAAYLDGRLAEPKAQELELHLSECARCREECEQVRSGMAIMRHLPRAEAPPAIWSSIEAALQERPARRMQPVLRWALASAVAGGLAAAGAVFWQIEHPAGPRWEIVRVGAGAKPVAGKVGAGEWIETDAKSSALLQVGEIGSIEIAPNTRLRVLTERPGDHRLALARGEIQAKISAPPKLFFVETASGTAVDLGCEYALTTNENGLGLLRVTKGWVSFQWKGLESLVPAGASCRTRPHAGPGIPYFDDAPETLKGALEAFGFDKSAGDTLGVILSASRVRDTLTLWHLLSRVAPEDRARVFDRMVALTPLPAGISREQALKLDPETLNRWKDELAWTW